MPAATAADIGARIEALYGQPLPELRREVSPRQQGTMIATLLGLHDDLLFAEHAITVHLERLRHLAEPTPHSDAVPAMHILDAAQRLAQAVAAREAHAKAATAVLDSLRRRESPPPPGAAAPAPAQPAAVAQPSPAR